MRILRGRGEAYKVNCVLTVDKKPVYGECANYRLEWEGEENKQTSAVFRVIDLRSNGYW